MNSDDNNKMRGLNVWFIIEILSFYGYITSAMWFILESQLRSSFGYLDKSNMKDRHKYDLINYHRAEIDWLAFVIILFTVNIGLMITNHFLRPELLTYEPWQDPNDSSLKPLMYQCLFNHFLQIVFLRHWFDENRQINTKHRWVWIFHAVNYPYMLYVYFFTDARLRDPS
jgi:hypothetical protein